MMSTLNFVLRGCFALCWLSLIGVALPAQGQDALSESSLPTLTNSIGMTLVQIPAGRFSMGSPASEPGSEEHEVLHKVELTEPYFLGITEVTEHQWALVMEDAFRTEEREVRDPETNRLVRKEEVQIRNPKLDSQLPITEVSWYWAAKFCERLSQLPEEKKEGRNYRLPTEAEWEHACRAGSGSAYSFGDDPSQLSTYGWQGVRKPQPVGQKKPNPWGLYDMHGNVAEWCFDYYGNYAEGLVIDPYGPERLLSPERVIRGGAFDGAVLAAKSTPERVIRGGAFDGKESQCRSGWRGKSLSNADKTIGFRIVLGPAVGPAALPSFLNSIGQRLVTFPPGRFRMGSEQSESDDFASQPFLTPSEKRERDENLRLRRYLIGDSGGFASTESLMHPSHDVVISRPFSLASTEVTQGQWKVVMGTEPWKGKTYVTEGDDYPATYVSWQDAVEFCRRLSELPEERAAGRSYRLPTEAEWEYACRGTLNTANKFRMTFNFGDSVMMLDDFAWHLENARYLKSPQPVGLKFPTADGLFDMHGNVGEWCSDWHATYEDNSLRDPAGPTNGNHRVVRGGGWRDKPQFVRSAWRSKNRPSNTEHDLGFRVALSSPEIPQTAEPRVDQ
ncbi:formylglycine-generating enzyme family protein [Pirellulaceae bacterium SH449]